MRGFWHALRALFLESETFLSGCGGHFIATKNQTKFLGDLHSADCYGGGSVGHWIDSAREYWMIYRWRGFLAVVWFSSSPILSPLSHKKTERERHGGGDRQRSRIMQPQGSLILYKSFNSLWSPLRGWGAGGGDKKGSRREMLLILYYIFSSYGQAEYASY